MRPMTKMLVGIVATAAVVAVATTGTVYANRSGKPVDAADITAKGAAPTASRTEIRQPTYAEIMAAAVASEAGYFIGTGDENGLWIRR
jgi:hypothetical protein